MKIKDFIQMDMDIDVYDDYDERLGIAFCYGYKLTDAGKEHFKDALEMDIEIVNGYGGNVGIVHCENGKEASTAKRFFDSIGGWCSSDDFDKWFEWIE